MPDDLSQSHAADVLRRAALLQARSESSSGVGLSLDEVKRAAGAAGIDGRFVEQAYLGAGEDLAPSEPFLGVETSVQRVRVVPGPVSDQEWGQMVLALRREFGGDGQAEMLGGVREWKDYTVRVQLEADGPNTRITASSEWPNDARVPLYFSGFYAVVSVLVTVGALVTGEGVAWWIAGLGLVLALLHAWYVQGPVRKRARTRGHQIDRALDALERLAGADERTAHLHTTVPMPEPTGAPPPTSRLDLSTLDAPPPIIEAPRDSSRQSSRES